MKILCALGEHNYGDPLRGEGYEYINFLPALRRLGHQVVFFESFSRAPYRDFADLNRQFLRTVQSERPDIILCVLLGYEIWLESLDMIRTGTDAVLINWSTDDSWKYEQFSRFVSPAFDIYATTYASAVVKSRRDGYANFFLTQWAANAATLAEPQPAVRCRYPVTFIGSAYGNRPRLIAELRRKGVDITCFGHGWENGAVSADEIPRIINTSVVSLNFADAGPGLFRRGPGKGRQIKARVFEVTGAGGCLVTESAEGLDRYFMSGKEIETFDDMESLPGKITELLQNQPRRDAIARAGFERTRRAHTYDQRFAAVLAEASQRIGARRRIDGQPAVDWNAFETVARTHRAGALPRLVATVVKMLFSGIWGRKRGPRAARRLVFEVSWRLAAGRTYSALGWPGRLFYPES